MEECKSIFWKYKCKLLSNPLSWLNNPISSLFVWIIPTPSLPWIISQTIKRGFEGWKVNMYFVFYQICLNHLKVFRNIILNHWKWPTLIFKDALKPVLPNHRIAHLLSHQQNIEHFKTFMGFLQYPTGLVVCLFLFLNEISRSPEGVLTYP